MTRLHPASLIAGLGVLMMTAVHAAETVSEPWDSVPPQAESLFHTHYDLGQGNSLWQIRLGGHARTMAEAYRNPDFGFSGVHEDAWVHHRIQAFMAMEHGRDFTLATELTWGEMQGRSTPEGPVDEDEPDLLQLYAQTRWDISEDAELVIRAGRQLLVYGSGRLLSHREGANQRLTHDAIRLGWHRHDWHVDGLFASPVRVEPGSFDNASYFGQTRLWGLYATGPSIFGPGHGIDLYYLGLHQENSPLSDGSERRHTFGTRWFGKTERWQYNHEFILQTGHSGDRDVLAGAISLGLARLFQNAPLKPTLGMKADLISGGRNDGHVNTFHPLFQANNYFNEGGFVFPSNLWNLNPNLRLELHRTVSLVLGMNFLWRYDSGDDVYGPPFNSLAGPAPNGESYLGTAYNLSLSWDPHPAFNVSLGLTHHEAGPSITALGGRSVDYLQVAARLEF